MQLVYVLASECVPASGQGKNLRQKLQFLLPGHKSNRKVAKCPSHKHESVPAKARPVARASAGSYYLRNVISRISFILLFLKPCLQFLTSLGQVNIWSCIFWYLGGYKLQGPYTLFSRDVNILEGIC